MELLDQALTKLVSTEVGIIQNDMKIASVGVIERLARAPMPLATLCPSLSRIHRTNRQSWVFFTGGACDGGPKDLAFVRHLDGAGERRGDAARPEAGRRPGDEGVSFSASASASGSQLPMHHVALHRSLPFRSSFSKAVLKQTLDVIAVRASW